jgi:hypothetical protein
MAAKIQKKSNNQHIIAVFLLSLQTENPKIEDYG